MACRRGHTGIRSTPTGEAHAVRRLSLRDIEPVHLSADSKEGVTDAESAAGAREMADRRRSRHEGDWRRRTTLVSSNASNTGSGDGGAAARRGSVNILTNQFRRLEAGNTEADQKCQKRVQTALNSLMWLVLTVIGAGLGLLLFILRIADALQPYDDGIRKMQCGLATTFLVELALRLYASGLAYCSSGVNLCDTYVVVGGGCLTYFTSWGSAAFFLRTARVCSLWNDRVGEGTLKKSDATVGPAEDESPAIQLYQLMMRAMDRSHSAFTAVEKGELRSLLSLLAHRQIYVHTSTRSGGEDYRREYEHSEKPHQTVSMAVPEGGSRWSFRRESTLSLTARAVLGAAMQNAEPNRIMGSVNDIAVEIVLAKVDDWDFDTFELDRVSQGHPLVTLGTYLFEVKYNFLSSFRISKSHFATFMVEVERGYGSGYGEGVMNLYHNRRHAADVTQAVHYFMQVCNLGQVLDDVEAIALLLGSLIHDFKHRGRSNSFLTKTKSHLALVYNDISVLENYHLSEAFRLLQRDSCDFFRDVDPAAVQEIRRIMVSMVLATDLKMHFDVLGEFDSHLADVQARELVGESKTKTYESAMKVCIKSADVSHAARAASLHLRWTKDVIEEFFLQGDEERLLGLAISPLCDRHTTAIASSQKNFIGFIVKPLFRSWVTFLDCPEAELCTANLEANEAMWMDKERSGDESLYLPGARSPLAQPDQQHRQQQQQQQVQSVRRPSYIHAVFRGAARVSLKEGARLDEAEEEDKAEGEVGDVEREMMHPLVAAAAAAGATVGKEEAARGRGEGLPRETMQAMLQARVSPPVGGGNQQRLLSSNGDIGGSGRADG